MSFLCMMSTAVFASSKQNPELVHPGQQFAQTIAVITSFPVYNLDTDQLIRILQPLMEENNTIKAIEIIDTIGNETLISFYRLTDKKIYNNKIPESIKAYEHFNASIKYDEELIGQVTLYYASKQRIDLTHEEKNWIAAHTIKVGVEQWDPVVFSNNGSDIDGIAGDVLKKIIKLTGLKTKIINERWNILLTDFKDKKIDILPATYYTNERAKYGLYSTDYFKMKDYLYVKEDNNNIHSMSDLDNSQQPGKLAIVEGYGTIDKIKEKFPGIQLVYTKDLDDSINRVLNGSVDALYEGQVAVKKKINEELISGLKGIAQTSFKAPGLHFFSRIDEPLLKSIIQKGLDSITEKERHKITLSWVDDINSADKKADLNPEEKSWIHSNTVKVGIEPWAPIIYFEDNKAKGFSADILNLVIKKTGLNVALVSGTWDELLNGFKNKKIDLLPDAYYSKDRIEFGYFSESYFTVRENIYIKNSNFDIHSFEDLSHKSLAIVKGFATIPFVREMFPNINIVETASFEKSVKMVLSGEVDALLDTPISSEYFFQEKGVFDLKGVPQFSLEGNKLHFLSRLDHPILHSILQKGLEAISREEKSAIVNRWLSGNDSLNFSKKEQAWIDETKPIRYVYNQDWAPFEWTNDVGQHAGFISDILRLIKTKSGLNLIYTKTESWEQATGFTKNRQADMYSAVGITEERQSYMNFSEKTLFSTPYVFVSRQGESFADGFELFNNEQSTKKIAVVGNYTIHGIMKKNNPNVPLTLLKGTNEGFNKLLSKEIDVFLVNSVTAKYYINKAHYKNLKISYNTDYQLNLHIAVRNDWPPEVLSIINKTISTIGSEKLNEIYKKWAKNEEALSIQLDYSQLGEQINELSVFELFALEEMLLAAFVAVLFAYFLYQNYSQSRFLNINFNRFILVIVGFEFLMISFILYELLNMDKLEKSLTHVHEDEHEMLKVADILRQSSDDLSHYAKSYVVTNNQEYKQNYLDILAIRNGTTARPENYQGIYWDLDKKIRKKLHPDTEKVPLKELIQREHFSDEEFDLLKQSEGNSNDLVNLEVRAFKAMQENNQALAIKLLHSSDYDKAKFKIMYPLDIFLSSINERSELKIKLIERNISNVYQTILFASVLFILGNYLIYLMLIKKIREPLHFLISSIQAFKSGNKKIKQKLFYDDELGQMNKEFFAMKAVLQDNEKELKRQLRISKVADRKQQELIVQINEQAAITQTAEEKTRLLLTSVGEGIFGVGSNGLVNFINPAALEMLQYQQAEILGQKIHAIIHHSHADGSHYPVEECPMHHALTQGKISRIDNEVLWRKDGSSFHVEYKARPVIKEGQVAGSVVTFSDITERINAHDLLLKQQLEIREIHKQTRDSIKYAALIQGALVPDSTVFQKFFQDFFAIWHPKDIVGGDIYLVEEVSENEVIIMVIDCTGHGVPGAFVTMLVKAVERQLTANIHKDKTISPANMLSIFNKSIKHLLQQDNIDSISNAGFDGGILYYNKKEKIIRFAGANTPLFVIQNSELITIKSNRHSIGYKKSDADYKFTEHTIDVSSPTQVYITTDGYIDQNGGEKGFPYGKKRFTQFILENAGETFADQQELLLYELQKYENGEERNDDVTVIGLNI
ncbi:MAG: transporter substrate-binding domain-containing protein [gamma proteobacterium symbiont of Taylorina sp.]|nr:transporter substrate-binding domain-containing protein [gamma proteobacterium symbiont of Taylorina sp.]